MMTDEERRLYAPEYYPQMTETQKHIMAQHEQALQRHLDQCPLLGPSLDDQRIVALEARVTRLIEQVERLLLEATKQLEAHQVVEFPRNALRHSR